MADRRLALTESAEKELKRLPNSMTARIAGRIEKLAANPRPSGCKKLKGGVNEWRIRIGHYRVIYEIEDGTKSVEVTRIAHRRSLRTMNDAAWVECHSEPVLPALIAGAGGKAA